jgi:hypothetical protein
LSSGFQTDSTTNASQRATIGIWVKMKKSSEYPFEHGEVINYTLDGVSMHTVTTKIQASFLTQLSEMKETVQRFHPEASCDFETEFGCDRKLRMDQKHYSYCTILT